MRLITDLLILLNSLAADIQLFICRSIPEQPSLTDIASKFYLSKTYLSGMF